MNQVQPLNLGIREFHVFIKILSLMVNPVFYILMVNPVFYVLMVNPVLYVLMVNPVLYVLI